MVKKDFVTYIAVFAVSVVILSVLPMQNPVVWQPEVMIALSAVLYTLLVYLSCQLVSIQRPAEVAATALFLLLFLPTSQSFMTRDIEAIVELGSQCIVPFFIKQFHKVSQRDFKYIYCLMLLMGIFCSYTHNGITIPLCSGFLWMWFLNRQKFFQMACWPMVVGFLIGTSISIWQAYHEGKSDTPSGIQQSISQTTLALQILWDTKVFLLSFGLTAYMSINRWGRQILLQSYKEHTLLSCCTMFSYCTLPFAPLGLDNAVTGVCFFCMYWTLILLKALTNRYYYNKQQL